MTDQQCLAIAKLMSRNGSKRTEAARKMAGKLARNTGHHRRSVQLLTKIVNLVNASSDLGSLEARCTTAVEWMENDQVLIQEQFRWNVTDVNLARAVISLAAVADGDDTQAGLKIRRQLGVKMFKEASRLARILVFSERVLNFATVQRKFQCNDSTAPRYEEAARIRIETDLYLALPATFRKRLEIVNRAARAA